MDGITFILVVIDFERVEAQTQYIPHYYITNTLEDQLFIMLSLYETGLSEIYLLL